MEADKSLALISDVYFLIQRFLSAGLLRKTLKVFNEELEENKVLPRRIDWEGNEHERTVEDMIKQFPNIRPDYLLQLCYQATNSSGVTLYNNKSLSSFLSFKPNIYNENKVLINFRQYFNYVARKHGAPIQKLSYSCNIINSIRGREVSGPISRQRSISPRLYEGIRIQRTTLGHLSAVYCLLFDHSGRYIITGADDLLIKLWSAHTGRLIAAFRGASLEITDIAVNSENTLLAAGSIDRILRVWNLQTGAPLAVLIGHTGMITSVNFCPTPSFGVRYLISTSSDGCVAFWTYTYESCSKVEFRNTPILYQEKIRPGQAQMICSSFSPGGTFLVTGSADHHVRIYYMKGDEGPHRILEIDAHRDRVDSIQWAHFGLKFLSGSKDGMAIIWWFEKQQWKSIHLDMATKLSSAKGASESDPKKLRVTMVCWNRSDDYVVTAVSDYTLKIWTATTGQLEKVLPGHTDEIYVLEAHPHDNDIILSAGHDGQLFIWDILKGETVFKFLNTIEGQGYGAIFDVKWSPNGSMMAASDSHGHILTFGFGTGSPLFEQLPKELFFHTDYRPLVPDMNHYVLDEQTQIPPHLMPPPFLVDMDGNPYPPMLQRLVPGRELCNVEQLVPNIVIGNEGTQEVIQDIPQNHLSEDLEENQDEDIRVAGSSFRQGRRNRDSERIRHSTGDWQSDPNMEWKENVLVHTLRKSVLDRAKEIRECIKDAETEEYQKQLRQRPHMISINTANNIKRKDEKKKKNTKYVTRATKSYEYKEEDHTESSGNYSESSGYSDWMAEEGIDRPKRSKRRPVLHSNSSEQEDDEEEDEEDDYDDEDEPRRSKENHVSRSSRENSRSARENHSGTSSRSRENGVSKVPTKSTPQVPKTAGPSTSGGIPRSKLKVSEQYRLSEWLSETRPRKSPYYPQMGDEIVYFIQGHQLYLDAVQLKSIYEISAKDLPWNKMPIRDHEFVKVIGIQYEIKPPRLCCLKLALLDEEGRLTGKVFTVKYHDMPDVLDFFVLKQMYDTALSRNWQIGDKFRCMIDDEWWIGHVINKSPASELYPHSSFMCYEIGWNNGEQERMSPWDMEPIDPERLPEDEAQSVPVLEPELTSIIYKSTPEDWPNSNRQSVTQHIVAGITNVMGLAIAEPFLVPVDINVYPSYAFIIEYPIDLSTIKARFENNFYRRLTAAQFDIRYLATNAEKFNERHSIIVKHARILTELCLRIVKHCSEYMDVPAIYHQLIDSYDSSDTEDEVEIVPSSSRNLRVLPNRSLKDVNDWKLEARNLVDDMWGCEDSMPFRVPVNILKYPDYQNVVKNPMDLGTVKENVINDKYENPEQFGADMRLIFQNSRLYNTNKRSRIYVMTVRLSAIFEEYIKKIIYNWKEAKRKVTRRRRSGSTASNNSSISSSVCFSTDEDRSLIVDDAKGEIASEDSDNMPLTVLRSKTNTESDSTSQGTDKIVPRSRKTHPDSEEEYCPSSGRNRPKLKLTSSDDDDEDLSSEESEKTNLRPRPVRRKKHLYKASDTDDSSSTGTRNKRRRLASGSDSDKSSRTETADGNFMSSVSSRGRVRKLTERAKALFKRR